MSQFLNPIRHHKEQIASTLIIPILNCLQHIDNPSHNAFRGCYDTHSSIAATWALLSYIRLVDYNILYLNLAKKLLEIINLKKEFSYWKSHIDCEMPYGRSWFLFLAIEYHKLFHINLLESIADNVAHSIINYLGYDKIIIKSEYKDPAFTLVSLLNYGKFYGKTNIIKYVSDRFIQFSLSCSVQFQGVFMNTCLNWVWLAAELLDKVQLVEWMKPFSSNILSLIPIETPQTIHEYGLNFSRCWVFLSLYNRTNDSRFAELYFNHFLASYKNPENWMGKYDEVSHWVSNFAFLALYPLLYQNCSYD
jgi:hypothetical protein